MKRLSMIAMAALLVLAMSCKKEKENENTTQGPGFRAAVETQTGDGKTHLEGSKVKWDNGDAIMVVNGSNAANEFTTDGATDAEGYAVFQSDATESFYDNSYKAYYPASLYNDGNVVLPGTQTYNSEIDNSFGKGFNPMVAQATDNTLEFKNLCGLLELQLTGECTVKSICITSKTNEMLWGTAPLTMSGNDGAMAPTLGTLTGGSPSITLNVNNAVTLTGSPTTFYFVLPAGSLNSGFNVLLTDSEDKVWKRSASNTAICRSKITHIGQAAVYTANPVAPIASISGSCISCTYTLSGSVEVPTGSHNCEFGIVYSQTDPTPTIEEGATKIVVHSMTDGAITGENDFDIDLNSLSTGVDYYVRAYAICDLVSYSSVKDYSTPRSLPSSWTNGKNPHPFTVASGKQVYFSRGNVQYNASGSSATATYGSEDHVGGTWRFALHQFDHIGADNENVAQTYNGWIDLFGWGTSGYNHNARSYQPWSTSTDNTRYWAYSTTTSTHNLSASTGKADWGKHFSNLGSWRTPTFSEWEYLFTKRSNAASRYGLGKVGTCINGLIILPDDWTGCPSGVSFTPGVAGGWTANVYSYADWAKMEAKGAVFLPASGSRLGTDVKNVHAYGGYWSSTVLVSEENQRAYFVSFSRDYLNYNTGQNRYQGMSVRLISDN